MISTGFYYEILDIFYLDRVWYLDQSDIILFAYPSLHVISVLLSHKLILIPVKIGTVLIVLHSIILNSQSHVAIITV